MFVNIVTRKMAMAIEKVFFRKYIRYKFHLIKNAVNTCASIFSVMRDNTILKIPCEYKERASDIVTGRIAFYLLCHFTVRKNSSNLISI